MKNKPLSILITGDLVINQPYNILDINPNVIEQFNKSDLNIVNLEAPVTTNNSKILKTGPHLKSNEDSTLEVLKALKVDVVTLANNHILDYDEQGVEDTLGFCKKNNIQAVGAGMNLKDASKTLFIETKEGRIAMVNFAENEWASATDQSAGANPMDIIDNAKQIKDARQKADFVFVIVHGGHEYFNLPSPRMQKQYRFYAEQGADIIIGHHTHCISGNEIYNDVPIYYSLGNFLFTKQSFHDSWYTGLILEIEINNKKLSTKVLPVKQMRNSFGLALLENKDKQEVLSKITQFNSIISNKLLLYQEWNKFIGDNYNSYLEMWSPLTFIPNRYVKGLLRRLRVKAINKKGMALKLNLMRCESHLDISKEVTKIFLNINK